MTILVTGAAGFIGFSLASRLLRDGERVFGIDSLSSYYDVSLKEARLAQLRRHAEFRFERLDIADRAAIQGLFGREKFDLIVHLAAQAGVRYSTENPLAYADANLTGFVHMLEGARAQKVGHFVFASSSSVYGGNRKLPFSETDNVDHPITLYGASKKANELIAHSYAHLFDLPCTGLRFFTVYGPWGRPDMALFKFTQGILAGETIPVFGEGRMVRDFTYIDDIVEGICRLLAKPPRPGPGDDAPETGAPYRIYNIGNGQPVVLIDYLRRLEECLGRQAKIEFQPAHRGEMESTMADVGRLERAIGYRPPTSVEDGVRKFVEWYVAHYNITL
jgi:UDP-glucuronate 4-epimerase